MAATHAAAAAIDERDPHLSSVEEIAGYRLMASDGEIGQVEMPISTIAGGTFNAGSANAEGKTASRLLRAILGRRHQA
jgi:hypothetical protein